jgi:hypothetical protein
MKLKTKSASLFLLLLLLSIVFIVITPFVGIWCLNTLFGFAIAYTWKNWVALFLLIAITKISISYGK